MYNRPPITTQEGSKGRPLPTRVTGKYDWRLSTRKKDRPATPTRNTGDGGSSLSGRTGGSLFDDLPPGLFGNGSHGSQCSDADSRVGSLLLPGRATPASSLSSSLAHLAGCATPYGDGVSRHSRGTSVDSAFDESQEKCINTAYRVSFQGDKRIKEMPFRIVIDGASFVLVERIVSGHSDGVYQKSKKVWENVPRGQARVFATLPATPLASLPTTPIDGPADLTGRHHAARSVSPDGFFTGSFASTHTLVASLNGLRKFAHWGDPSAHIYNLNKEVPVTAVVTEKVDGESCHVAAFTFDDVRYWVIGLRDRHLLVRLTVPEEDVAAYDVDADNSQRCAGSDGAAPTSAAARAFTRASMVVARAWRRLLRDQLTEAEVLALHQQTAEGQWTLCFDAAVQGCEHFVDYYGFGVEEEGEEGEDEEENSSLELRLGDSASRCGSPAAAPHSPLSPAEAYAQTHVPLLFYAITANEPADGGLCLPLDRAMDFFRAFKLPTVSHSVPLEVNLPEYDAERAAVSSWPNSAGAVFYGSNEQGVVVRLWKCRCHPHELERVAQELIATHRLHGDVLRMKLLKKVSGLCKEARAATVDWAADRLPFLVAFADWLHDTQQVTPSTDLATLQELRGHWVTAQHACQAEMMEGHLARGGGNGEGAAGDEEEDGDDDDEEEEEAFAPEAILLMGPQGCGKSTLARAVFVLLEQAGCIPRWINQDEVGNRAAYLSAIQRAAVEGLYTHIILDKMNLDEASRGDYRELRLNTVLTVAWCHPRGTDALVEVCFDRVKRRGSNHRTFKAMADVEDKPVQSSPNRKRESPAGGSDRGGGGGGGAPATTAGWQLSVPPPLPDPTSTGHDARFSRVRGILRDCAARYDPPEHGDGLVEVEVTLNCNATAQRVWSRLRERSVYELPPLADLDAEQAFRVAFAYEELMSAYPHRITAVVLQAESAAHLRAVVPPELLESAGKKALEHLHVVLHNFTEQPSPSALVHYARLVGKSVHVDLRAVIADSKATVLHVSGGGASLAGARGGHPPAAAPCGDGESVPLHMAVLSKAKKVTYRYCAQLLERAIMSSGTDPCVVVKPLPRGTSVTFQYMFVTNR